LTDSATSQRHRLQRRCASNNSQRST